MRPSGHVVFLSSNKLLQLSSSFFLCNFPLHQTTNEIPYRIDRITRKVTHEYTHTHTHTHVRNRFSSSSPLPLPFLSLSSQPRHASTLSLLFDRHRSDRQHTSYIYIYERTQHKEKKPCLCRFRSPLRTSRPKLSCQMVASRQSS